MTLEDDYTYLGTVGNRHVGYRCNICQATILIVTNSPQRERILKLHIEWHMQLDATILQRRT